MFEVEQLVKNYSSKRISVASYGRINRVLNGAKQGTYILHEGPIGVMGEVLQRLLMKIYKKIKNYNLQLSVLVG